MNGLYTLLLNVLHNNIYSAYIACLDLDLKLLICNVARRGHFMKIFISHVNCNVVKNSFFHQTVLI